jgi:LPXTG-motif cell wall-anchored protein
MPAETSDDGSAWKLGLGAAALAGVALGGLLFVRRQRA